MRGTASPGTQRRYPLTMICEVFGVARSSVYAAAGSPAASRGPAKRAPKTEGTDATLLDAIRTVLAGTPFHGEGYRKVRARLAHRAWR